MDIHKEYIVMDKQGHQKPVAGYQQASQLARTALEKDDQVMIIIMLTKGETNGNDATGDTATD